MTTRNRAHLANVAFFVALMSTAIALSAGLAHVFELINKMALDREAYFTVQQIYAGWNLFAVVLLFELAAILAVIVLHRRQRIPVIAAGLALGGLIGAQVAFWTYTFPANVATQNWMVQPDNWEALRDQWEYSHLAGALFQLIAMAALIVALIAREKPSARFTPAGS